MTALCNNRGCPDFEHQAKNNCLTYGDISKCNYIGDRFCKNCKSLQKELEMVKTDLDFERNFPCTRKEMVKKLKSLSKQLQDTKDCANNKGI